MLGGKGGEALYGLAHDPAPRLDHEDKPSHANTRLNDLDRAGMQFAQYGVAIGMNLDRWSRHRASAMASVDYTGS